MWCYCYRERLLPNGKTERIQYWAFCSEACFDLYFYLHFYERENPPPVITRAALSAEPPTKVCRWVWDEDNHTWHCGCGKVFLKENVDPVCTFCPSCGGRIEEGGNAQ